MTAQSYLDQAFEEWSTWFQGVPDGELRRSFTTWQHLDQSRATMQEILGRTALMPDATGKVKKVSRKLDYRLPYRVVVLGETGAGKSTLINAVLGQIRLVTGAGGAITGVPVYVHPIDAAADERVVVSFRNDQEFGALVQSIAKHYSIDLPTARLEIAQTYKDSVTQAKTIDDETRQRLLDAFADILQTWQRLDAKGQVGTSRRFNPQSDREILQQLMEEKSKVNTTGSDKRVIPGISRIEYFVCVADAALSSGTLQSNAVLIDTPGIGAQTLRHQEILRQEVLEADAVILVVGARRPEEKSASLAYLLEQALLGSFSPEEKDHFAQKVFLVVNQMDAIRSSEDRRRLQDSVESLCNIISPNFAARHVYGASELRYFETVAHMAVMAQIRRRGEGLPQYEEGAYRAELQQLLSDEERSATSADEIALNKSGVLDLRTALNSFLVTKRLQLMLDEAEVLLRQVPKDAEAESQAFFARHGLTLDDTMALDTLSERNTRQLCNKQLERDHEALLANCRGMIDHAQQWRGSKEYRQSLREKTAEICAMLDQKMDTWVADQLPAWVVETPDPVAGPTHMEMHKHSFLIKAEQTLRGYAEDEAQHLADYYLEHFQELLKSDRIYEMILEKSYDQPYVEQRVHPVASLRATQTEIGAEFSEICRWVLIYELLRDPILGSQDVPDSQIPRIAKEVAMQLAELALSVSITTASPTAAVSLKAAGGFLSKLRQAGTPDRQPEEKPQTKVPPDPEDQRRAADFKKLSAAIQTALEKRDVPQLQVIITRELSKRNKLALSKSLPFLDMLFFYQLDKYHQVYRAKVDELYREHIDQVADRNMSIRQILVRKNDVTLLQAGELLQVLRELRQVA